MLFCGATIHNSKSTELCLRNLREYLGGSIMQVMLTICFIFSPVCFLFHFVSLFLFFFSIFISAVILFLSKIKYQSLYISSPCWMTFFQKMLVYGEKKLEFNREENFKFCLQHNHIVRNLLAGFPGNLHFSKLVLQLGLPSKVDSTLNISSILSILSLTC